MNNTLFQNESVDEILNDIKIEDAKRDVLLTIYKKLRNYYVSTVFLKLLMVALPIWLLFIYTPSSLISNFLLFIIFILFTPFIFSLNRFPAYILNQYELSTVNYRYGYLLYYERDIGYMKPELANRILGNLDEMNKRIEELKVSRWYYELLDYEKDKYIQIRDKIDSIENKRNRIERLVEALKEQTTVRCPFDGLFTSSYPIDGLFTSSYPIDGFDFNDLEFITSNSYLCEHFKSALINNNLNVKKSFKKDVVSYLSQIADELKLAKDELSNFKKNTSQQKRLDFINAM